MFMRRQPPAQRWVRPITIFPAPAAPLTPADYLRLRRRAAGLSIEQVGEALAPRLKDRAAAVDLLRSLETPGIRARARRIVELLARVFPLDPDVYFQLANDTPERHPSVCRGCGCSAYDPCTGVLGVCSWPDRDRCSRCDDGGHA